MPSFLRVFFLLFVFSTLLFAEGAGRGGPFLEYHTSNISNFDSGVSGYPLVIGGVGFGSTSKDFRVGGGGGGGFLWNGSDNLAFGIGYGGLVGEYQITKWLALRMLVGGGGYAVGKILSQTDTTTTTQKINSGGFLLFHPSVFMQVKLTPYAFLGGNIGYFLPNVGKLHSLTIGVNLLIGK